MEFNTVFNQIRDTKLVSSDCELVVCQDAPSASTYFWFGAIGAAISESSREKSYYVLAFENDTIYLFDIDIYKGAKTARYLGTVVQIPFSDIKRIGISTFITKEINIITKQKTSVRLLTSNKFMKFNQKDAVKKVFDALKLRRKNK